MNPSLGIDARILAGVKILTATLFIFCIINTGYFGSRQVEIAAALPFAYSIVCLRCWSRFEYGLFFALGLMALEVFILYAAGYYNEYGYTVEGILIFPRAVFMLIASFGFRRMFGDRDDIIRIYIYVSAATVACSILECVGSGVLGYPSMTFPDGDGRMFGLSSNPNYFGFMLIIPFSFVLLNPSIVRVKWFRYVLLCLIFAGIFMTMSRGVWVSCLFLLAVYFYRWLPIGKFNVSLHLPVKFHLIVVVMCCVIAGITLVSDQRYLERLDGFSPSITLSKGGESQKQVVGGGAGRYALWLSAARSFIASDLEAKALGNGIGSFPHVVTNDRNYWAHNGYVTLVIDLGIVGLSFFAFVIGTICWVALNGSDVFKGSLVCGVFAILIFSASNSIFYIPQFWFMIALIIPVAITGRRVSPANSRWLLSSLASGLGRG